MHGITLIRDEVYTPYIGSDPVPEPPLGEPRYATDGKYIGTQDTNSRLAGTWVTLSTALNAPADYASLKTDSSNLFHYVYPDGFIRSYGLSSGTGDGLVDGGSWDGWLWRVRPNVYQLANGVPGTPGYGCALYTVLLNRSGDMAVATLLSDKGCGNPPHLFWENNILFKLSDQIDESIMADIRKVADQWL